MRYHVTNSSYFDSNKYDSNKMKAVIKQEGGEYIRLAHNYGWSNQPRVVCFNVRSSEHATKIENALRKAFKTTWISISKKDW